MSVKLPENLIVYKIEVYLHTNNDNINLVNLINIYLKET